MFVLSVVSYLCTDMCVFVFYFFPHSELLCIHLRYTAATVSAHVSSDWLHHGLEDEGV